MDEATQEKLAPIWAGTVTCNYCLSDVQVTANDLFLAGNDYYRTTCSLCLAHPVQVPVNMVPRSVWAYLVIRSIRARYSQNHWAVYEQEPAVRQTRLRTYRIMPRRY